MTEMLLPVTFTFISLYAMSLFSMVGWIGMRRGNTLRGDRGDPVLFKRIRVHGNLIENAPAFAFALAASELAGLAQVWLWAAVVSFIAGRIVHFALFDTEMRWSGMLLTTGPSALMGIWLLIQVWL
jgi:uncharacterized membrane protein YecN with MAPEG domain